MGMLIFQVVCQLLFAYLMWKLGYVTGFVRGEIKQMVVASGEFQKMLELLKEQGETAIKGGVK